MRKQLPFHYAGPKFSFTRKRIVVYMRSFELWWITEYDNISTSNAKPPGVELWAVFDVPHHKVMLFLASKSPWNWSVIYLHIVSYTLHSILSYLPKLFFPFGTSVFDWFTVGSKHIALPSLRPNFKHICWLCALKIISV